MISVTFTPWGHTSEQAAARGTVVDGLIHIRPSQERSAPGRALRATEQVSDAHDGAPPQIVHLTASRLARAASPSQESTSAPPRPVPISADISRVISASTIARADGGQSAGQRDTFAALFTPAAATARLPPAANRLVHGVPLSSTTRMESSTSGLPGTGAARRPEGVQQLAGGSHDGHAHGNGHGTVGVRGTDSPCLPPGSQRVSRRVRVQRWRSRRPDAPIRGVNRREGRAEDLTRALGGSHASAVRSAACRESIWADQTEDQTACRPCRATRSTVEAEYGGQANDFTVPEGRAARRARSPRGQGQSVPAHGVDSPRTTVDACGTRLPCRQLV